MHEPRICASCTTSSEITRSPTFISRRIHAHQIHHSSSLWDFWVVLLLTSVPLYIISYHQQVVLTNTWLPRGTPSYKLHLPLIYSSIFLSPVLLTPQALVDALVMPSFYTLRGSFSSTIAILDHLSNSPY